MPRARQVWKTCGRSVHFLLTAGQRKYFLRRNPRSDRVWTVFRTALRLIDAARSVEFHASPNKSDAAIFNVTNPVHLFEESIAGRAYLIEVASVDPNRWRACIVKAPGVRTALMPFYGPTPDEAADQLRGWLTRAYARAAGPVRQG